MQESRPAKLFAFENENGQRPFIFLSGSEHMIFGFDPNDAERILNDKGPYEKANIEVTVLWKKTGEMVPLSFVWDDREYKIDKILERKKGESLKFQSHGFRYRCQVGKKIFYLYYDNTVWYVELRRF